MKINELITEQMDVWTAAQTPKRNGGRGRTSNGNANGNSSHGIKRLRELILELAVRGKLVPQDPKDEPASVLLEKIAKEKKRLIKEGKIKKQKPLAEVGEDEKPFELPKGWEWARLREVGHDWGQKTPDKDFTYIEVSAIDNVAGTVKSPTVLAASEAPSRARKIVKVGTVIYSTVRPYLQNISVIEQEYSPEPIASTAFAILHPFQKMPGKFLAMYLKSPVFVSYVESVQTGIAYPAINDKQFFSGVISIPPLPEQHRIVTKVNELMTLCDQLEQQQTHSTEAHQTLVSFLLATLTQAADPKEFDQAWQRIADHFDTLFTTEAGIDQLKQTLLQLAVMGKLVPQDPNDLPAPQPGKYFVYALECEDKSIYIGQTEDVLKRWKQHATGEGAEWTKKHPPIRLVHWEAFDSRTQAVEREKELKTGFGRKWLKRELAAGRTRQAGEPASVLLEKIAKEKKRLIKAGKIKKQKPLPEIGEDEKPFELPVGWEWVRFDHLMNPEYPISYGVLVPGPDTDNGIPFVRISDLDLINPPEQPEKSIDREIDGKYERTRLMGGEILMGVVGSIGKLGLAPKSWRGANIARAICRIWPIKLISKPFLIWLLQSDFMQHGFSGDTRTLAQPTLNIGMIKSALTPLPPLNEQKRIVAKVNELMTLCDKLKARLNQAQTTQRQLADAIVEQAVA